MPKAKLKIANKGQATGKAASKTIRVNIERLDILIKFI